MLFVFFSNLFVSLANTFQKAMGRRVMVEGRVKSVPKQMTTPIGIQSDVPAVIIGITPNAVVAEVRKMGRILLNPASNAASFADLCCTFFSVSA